VQQVALDQRSAQLAFQPLALQFFSARVNRDDLVVEPGKAALISGD
jgi:hypothetical protein